MEDFKSTMLELVKYQVEQQQKKKKDSKNFY